jgi:hypothetical protein
MTAARALARSSVGGPSRGGASCGHREAQRLEKHVVQRAYRSRDLNLRVTSAATRASWPQSFSKFSNSEVDSRGLTETEMESGKRGNVSR